MTIVLYLHIVVETIVGFLLLFYPRANNLIPGFATGEGESYQMVVKMYGLAALFLAAVGLVAWLKRKKDTETSFLLVALLSGFHLLMAGIQFSYNPDTRGMLLHFLLSIFLAGIYVRRDTIVASGL